MTKKPGMYATVLSKLLKIYENPDPTKQEKINAVKATITDRGATNLAQMYVQARQDYNVIQETLSMSDTKIKALEQLLAASQEQGAPEWGQYGVPENALLLPTGHVIRVQEKPDAKVVDREAFRQWCMKNGYERELHMNFQKMVAIVKERLREGEPEPEGCEAFRYTAVRLEKP